MAIDVETEDDEPGGPLRISSRDEPLDFMFASVFAVVYGSLVIIAETLAFIGQQVSRVSKILGAVVWFLLTAIACYVVGYLLGYAFQAAANYIERKFQEQPLVTTVATVVLFAVMFAVAFVLGGLLADEALERYRRRLGSLDEKMNGVEVTITDGAEADDD